MQAKFRFISTAIFSVLMAPLLAAHASYPDKPIRLVVPYAPGGGTDNVARVVAKVMSTELGQPIVVENRPGAGTAIGAALVAKAAPDGYTVLWGDNTTFALNPALHPDLSYAPLKDFAPISLTLQGGLTIVVSNDLGVNSVAELLEYAKKNPGKLQYGTAGNGTPHHLAMESFKLKTGLEAMHVPYKGEAQAVSDLLGGQINLMFAGALGAKQALDSGKAKILAVSTSFRNPVFADVPTVAESGVPGFDASFWHAIAVPAGTPEDVILKLNKAYTTASRDKDVLAFMAVGGSRLRQTTPQQARDHISQGIRESTELVKAINLKLD